MVDDPEKEIMLDPQRGILQDGNGYQVMLMGGMPFVDNNGRRCVKLKIFPDNIVRKRYNLRRGAELNENDGTMFIICLEIDVIPLNPYDDSNRKWLYVKSFKHDATHVSDRESFLKNKLNTYEHQVLLLQAKVIKLQEELNLATLQTGKYLSQSGELIEKSATAIATAIKKKDEEGKNG